MGCKAQPYPAELHEISQTRCFRDPLWAKRPEQEPDGSLLFFTITCSHLDEVGQTLLVLELDRPPLLLEGLVIRKLAQASQLISLGNPLVASQGLRDELAEAGVAVRQPAAGGDTVGLVLELLR